MRRVTYSLGMSLDGYITPPDGSLDWSTPDPEVFQFATDQVRELDVHLLGRRLYEAMLFWENPEQNPNLDAAELEFAALWNALPKVVFSNTLSEVRGNARLATRSLADEIAHLQGDIGIGGATLAADAAALGLIDEYRPRVHPTLLGGGMPFFPQTAQQTELELLETRAFESQVMYLRYRVRRAHENAPARA